MSRATPSPATIAITDTAVPLSDSVTIANAAAAPAPDVMPMTSGLASGLRSIVWNVTPPNPKQAPVASAVTARGSRSAPTVKRRAVDVLPEDHPEHLARCVEGVADQQRDHEHGDDEHGEDGDDDPPSQAPAGPTVGDRGGGRASVVDAYSGGGHSSRTRWRRTM